MDEGARRVTPRSRSRARQRTRSLGTLRTRIPEEIPRLVEATKSQSLARQPPNEMARHRRIHLLVRRAAPTRRIYRRKQRVCKPLPSRTPPLHRYRSDETPAPRWLRRDETEGNRRHEVESDHPKHVRQPRQHKRIKYRKLAKRAPTRKAAASAVLPTSPTKYEGMDPTRYFHQPKLHQELDPSHKFFHGTPCL